MDVFDDGVRKYRKEFEKPAGEFRVTYAGSIGKSYDVKTLVDAAKVIEKKSLSDIKFYILGTGPLKEELEQYAKEIKCDNVIFMGYVEYQKMAAFLSESDLLVNSYIKSAPQSIVTKIGDYLSAGKPIINTLSSPEFCKMVEEYDFGVNVEAEDAEKLVEAILKLHQNASLGEKFSFNARRCAEERFDRKVGYRRVVEMVEDALKDQ